MSKRNYKFFIKDIKECTDKILMYVGNKSFENFSKDQLLIDAIVRNLEIIGEAVKHVPNKLKQENPHIEWHKIAGLRDILIHEYFGIDYEVLWDIVQNKIPNLNVEIKKLLEK
ncbi:MAG: DUF86 domain-containing protein [bacterium]|nr:DUF86 domain-containing protein [bacterium]